MSKESDGTETPVPAKKKPILLEDIKGTQQPRTGTGPQLTTDLSGYPADPEFQLRGGFENLMLDAASPLFGLVIRLRTLDDLLPLRYAAIGGNPAQRARLPKLPSYLSPFSDVGEMTHSSYAIRPLREGFFYLLIKRHSAPVYEWHSQYRVAPNGSLLYISADAPWEPAPSAGNLDEIIRSFGWTITLYDLDDIQELRPLFSPSPLTPRMLDNYRLLEDEYRSSLPAIDVARFIQPSDAPPQPHVLKHDQLSWVADFKAQDDTDLQALLDLQPFNNDQIVSPHASRQALAPLVNQSKPRGAALVIEDAIGILIMPKPSWLGWYQRPWESLQKSSERKPLDYYLPASFLALSGSAWS